MLQTLSRRLVLAATSSVGATPSFMQEAWVCWEVQLFSDTCEFVFETLLSSDVLSYVWGLKKGLLLVLAFSSDGVSEDIMLCCFGIDASERILAAQSKFANCCQKMVPETSGAPWRVVSKKFSKMTVILWWDTPCHQIENKVEVPSGIGLGPKLSPRCVLGDQHGTLFPDASAFSKAHTGQPKVCTCFMLLPTQIELKSSSLDVPSSSTGWRMWRYAVLYKAYGHKVKWTVSGH